MASGEPREEDGAKEGSEETILTEAICEERAKKFAETLKSELDEERLKSLIAEGAEEVRKECSVEGKEKGHVDLTQVNRVLRKLMSCDFQWSGLQDSCMKLKLEQFEVALNQLALFSPDLETIQMEIDGLMEESKLAISGLVKRLEEAKSSVEKLSTDMGIKDLMETESSEDSSDEEEYEDYVRRNGTNPLTDLPGPSRPPLPVFKDGASPTCAQCDHCNRRKHVGLRAIGRKIGS